MVTLDVQTDVQFPKPTLFPDWQVADIEPAVDAHDIASHFSPTSNSTILCSQPTWRSGHIEGDTHSIYLAGDRH